MSKERGFAETPVDMSVAPSAPPSYDEAMQQAGAAYMPMPGTHYIPQPVPVGPSPQPSSYAPPAPQPATLPYPPVQPPAPAAPPTTIIITNMTLGRDRCYMMCPKCNAQVLTETLEENHCMAHVWCMLLMCLGCPCCSCLPYCMDSCKTIKHSCPNCRAKLGTYKPY